MALIDSISPVFAFLRDFWDALPVALQLLVTSAFSGVVFISVLRNIRN